MIIEIIGWLGAILILYGYFLISTKREVGNSKRYQLINLFGAIFLIINAYSNSAWPLVGLNFIWILIALKSLIK